MTATALPPRMRALVWPGAGEPLEVRDLPTPSIEGSGEVIVRVLAAMFGAALVRAITVGHPKHRPPTVLGSLVAGEIVAIGDAVEDFRVGDQITLDPHSPCGVCAECQGESAALCAAQDRVDPGAHAEFVRLAGPGLRMRRLPDGLAMDEAVLAELVACALDAVQAAGVGRGHDVVVIGSGPLGMLLVQAALAAKARTVVCATNRRSRAALATHFGAVSVDARGPGGDQKVLARVADGGAHVVIEAVGRRETYEQALRLVRSGGTVVAFGGCPPGTTLCIDPNLLHYRRIRLIGSYHYRPGRFDEALESLANGRIRVRRLISHRLSLEEAVDITRVIGGDSLAVLVSP